MNVHKARGLADTAACPNAANKNTLCCYWRITALETLSAARGHAGRSVDGLHGPHLTTHISPYTPGPCLCPQLHQCLELHSSIGSLSTTACSGRRLCTRASIAAGSTTASDGCGVYLGTL
jgi:hypothetical protein